MVEKFGVYYLPYRRLRIAAVTDYLAYLVARIRDLEEDSAAFFAVRVLIRAWREKAYPDYHRPKPDQQLKPQPSRLEKKLRKSCWKKRKPNSLRISCSFTTISPTGCVA